MISVLLNSNFHPTDGAIDAYAGSRLTRQDERLLEQHLSRCEACMSRLLAQRQTTKMSGPPFRQNQQAEQFNVDTPKILPFETHLPLYDIESVADKFGTSQREVEPRGWVEVPRRHVVLTQDMYVTQIRGHSAEPTIPDGSLCVFKGSVSPPYEGKVVLIEDLDETGHNRYSVKKYHTSKNVDPNTRRGWAWLHERVSLDSINPDYLPKDLPSAQNINVIGEFVLVVTKDGNL